MENLKNLKNCKKSDLIKRVNKAEKRAGELILMQREMEQVLIAKETVLKNLIAVIASGAFNEGIVIDVEDSKPVRYKIHKDAITACFHSTEVGISLEGDCQVITMKEKNYPKPETEEDIKNLPFTEKPNADNDSETVSETDTEA